MDIVMLLSGPVGEEGKVDVGESGNSEEGRRMCVGTVGIRKKGHQWLNAFRH